MARKQRQYGGRLVFDFELEFIQIDKINVRYILQLLTNLKGTENDKDYEYQYKSIMQSLGGTPELRS